ncbi:hypothetical protein FisN_9Lh044 [Fistulifera solaris]|uniref:Uncharacterized protein n=1 Tax=Fistulifera solaris TaxID=1519565 RepID=A0A1Z5KKH1_FISSO|nr:hypothetical protein FisN_9Lh044 [Fistulifera solaris]|eukprot:GAX26779.1 hypothetical protein FisN_9Lh044 [Fistulifera solaris]
MTMILSRKLFVFTILFAISCCLWSLTEDKRNLAEKTANTGTNKRNATQIEAPNITTEIFIQLSGQFGNHISKIAAGVAVAIELESRGRHTSLTLLRPRRGHSAEQTTALLQQCFPSLRNVSFDNNHPDLVPKPLSWNQDSPSDFDKAIDLIFKSKTTSVLIDHLSGLDLIVDRHYKALRRFFTIDCCSSKIQPYHTVFHYRNFEREMPRRGKQKGYEELSAQFVNELFHDNNHSTPILIVTPYAPDVKNYVDVLQNQGRVVHTLAKSTPLLDFCMLISATETIIGLARSTFFLWAGFLGNAPHIRAYSIDSEWKRQSNSPVWDHYNWTDPELNERFHFELYHLSSR